MNNNGLDNENGKRSGFKTVNHKRRIGCALIALCVVFVCAVFGVSAQEDTLVSGGKTYSFTYGTVEETMPYMQGYTANLTDGVAAETFSDEAPGEWFCFFTNNKGSASLLNTSNRVGEVIIDLGEQKTSVNNYRVHLLTTAMPGAYLPESITVSLSDTVDGAYTESASATDFSSDKISDWFDITPAAAGSGRYVKFAVAFASSVNVGYIFLNELEVYTGAASAAESSEPSSETTSETTSAESSEESLGEPKFAVTLGDPGEWVADSKFEVTASVTDIEITGGVYIVSFVLQYDPAKLELLNEESEDGSLFVETNLPGEDWENLTHADRENGLIEVEFSNPSGSDSAAVNDGDIALAFTFMPKTGLSGNVAVAVKANSAVAGDKNFGRYAGTAGSVSIPEGHIPSWIEVEHRNCGHSGVRHCYCSVCGKLLDTEVTPPTGEHTPGEWSVTREAKYGVAGSREKRCTVCGKVVETELIPAIIYPKGDINGNGVIDAQDYAMAKRSVLGTFKLTDAQTARGDIDSNGKVDAWDYAKIKRHFLGTYVIEN